MTKNQEGVSPDAESTQSVVAELEHTYRFQAGDKIAERYQVIDQLGFGGFAEVYHCQDLDLPRTLAVKVLIQEEIRSKTEDGLQDARAAARLEHPHIVQVIDISKLNDGTPLIIFRYVEGETLETRLNRAQYRRLDLSGEALRIVHQVAQALDYAHSNQVIHRDVKPSNIILDRQKNAYLTDFGIAEIKQPPEGESMLSIDVQQRLSGTIPYMAPEQLKEGEPGDERSDLYSLGVVVYEMLTGQLPYRGRDVGLIFQIGTSEPLPPTLANPELPKGIEPVLLRALDKDPDQRYPSCQAFAQELEATASAYVAASEQYEAAKRLLEDKKWRQALLAFEALAQQTPDFRDADRHLEQARHQVRLLELFEEAQAALERAEYQKSLDTVNVLTQLEPGYDVADLRRQAREGLAREERKSLDQLYERAVEQFHDEEYQACLDTLAVIRERDSNYPDAEGVEEPAREKVGFQRRLRELYNQGVEDMGQEKWEQAIASLEKLQQEAPGYEDVETRLSMARHMGRMSSLLREARRFLDQGDFAACIDKLDELQGIDAKHKGDEVASLRQQALKRLYERANRLLKEKKFEQSLETVVALRERVSDRYPGLDEFDLDQDLDEIEAEIREGMRTRDLQARLDDLYQQAVDKLGQRDFAGTLKLWETIQKEKEDLEYPDQVDVQARAKEGLCASLYQKALGALAQKNPQQALKLWRQVLDIDPDYPDSQRIEQQSEEMMAQADRLYGQAQDAIEQKDPQKALELLRQTRQIVPPFTDSANVQEQAQALIAQQEAEQRKQRRFWAVGIGGGGILLLLVLLFASGIFSGPSEVPTTTPTFASTPAASPKSTTPTVSTATVTEKSEPTLSDTLTPESPADTVPVVATTVAPTPSPTVCPLTMTLVQDVNYRNFQWWGTVNSSFEKTWRLRNDGGCAWPEDTVLVHLDGESFGLDEPHGVGSLAMDQEIELSISLQVPGTAGQYEGRFQLRGPDGKAFGEPLLVRIEARDYEPTPTGSPPVLTIDFWDLDGTERCAGGFWYKSVWIQGQGGDRVYTYYINEEYVAGPLTNEGFSYEVRNADGGRIVKGRIESGDGQVAEKEIFIQEPECAK